MNYKTIAILSASIIVSACSSNDTKPDLAGLELKNACVFKGTDVTAPDWVCTRNVKGMLSGIGVYQNAGDNLNLAYQTAQLRGRVDLIRKLNQEIDLEIADFQERSGAGAGSTNNNYNRDISKATLKSMLRGSDIFASVFSPDDTLYVLMGIDEELARSRVAAYVTSSYKNPEATFIKTEAQKALSDLEQKRE